MTPLPESFYSRGTITVARDLLGKTLVRRLGDATLTGIITETEAYGYSDDPASHAFGGMTQRNRAMFGAVGRSYVYFTYGMHYCANIVARGKRSSAGAVLIRAMAPQDGLARMMKNRKKNTTDNLTDGPAKITQALQISKKQYGLDLTKPGELFVADGMRRTQIVSSPRVGIKRGVQKRWNFKMTA